MAREGRRNWREKGRMRAVIIIVEMAVLTKGPGEGMMHREKMPRIKSIRY